MQEIGEMSLATRTPEQQGWHGEVGQQPVQHGQHALALPLPVVAAELQHARLPGQLVVLQGVEVVVSHPQARHGQGRVQAPLAVGLGAGGQPHLQLQGRRGLEDALLVGEVDAPDAAREQRRADRPGLVAVVDQHGEIGRLEGAEGLARLVEAGAPGSALHQQLGHPAGAARGHLVEVGGLAQPLLGVLGRQVPERHGG